MRAPRLVRVVAPKTRFAEAHVVSYRGTLERALLDLDDWVTRDIAPPATSAYHVDSNTQIVLASAARERGGVQPLSRPRRARTNSATSIAFNARERPLRA